MNIEKMPEPIDALVMTDVFSIMDRDIVFNEISLLLENDSGSGIWINQHYDDINDSVAGSNIVSSIFNEDVVDSLTQVNPMYGLIENVNNHSTIFNYYGHAQSSPMRYDSAAFIAKSFFFSNPKNFSGGNFTVQVGADIAYEKDIEDNMTIIFPAFYYHQISEVRIDDRDIANSGLYVATTYLFIGP